MKVTICIGSSCHVKGAREVVRGLQELAKEQDVEKRVEFAGDFCMGACTEGVCVTVDGQRFSVSPAEVGGFFTREIMGRLAL